MSRRAAVVARGIKTTSVGRPSRRAGLRFARERDVWVKSDRWLLVNGRKLGWITANSGKFLVNSMVPSMPAGRSERVENSASRTTGQKRPAATLTAATGKHVFHARTGPRAHMMIA